MKKEKLKLTIYNQASRQISIDDALIFSSSRKTSDIYDNIFSLFKKKEKSLKCGIHEINLIVCKRNNKIKK